MASIAAGAVVYVSSSGTVYTASGSTDPRTIPGVATMAGSSGDSILVANAGVTYVYSGLTAGTQYWMDQSTGLPTATMPSSGLILQMGYAVSSTGLSIQLVPYASTTYPGQVQPDGTTITIAAGVISSTGGGGPGGLTGQLQWNNSGVLDGCSGITTPNGTCLEVAGDGVDYGLDIQDGSGNDILIVRPGRDGVWIGNADGSYNGDLLYVNPSGLSVFSGSDGFEFQCDVSLTTTVTTYNSVATAGIGLVPVRAAAAPTGLTTTSTSIWSSTPGADASLQIGVDLLITSGLGTVVVAVAWTDVASGAHTDTLCTQAGTGFTSAIKRIRAKASTTVVVSATLTGMATYNVSPDCLQTQ